MEKHLTTDYESVRADYETPRIEDHGDLTELTAGFQKGAHVDANFKTGDLATFLSG
jgi:hypothetical protein